MLPSLRSPVPFAKIPPFISPIPYILYLSGHIYCRFRFPSPFIYYLFLAISSVDVVGYLIYIYRFVSVLFFILVLTFIFGSDNIACASHLLSRVSAHPAFIVYLMTLIVDPSFIFLSQRLANIGTILS